MTKEEKLMEAEADVYGFSPVGNTPSRSKSWIVHEDAAKLASNEFTLFTSKQYKKDTRARSNVHV